VRLRSVEVVEPCVSPRVEPNTMRRACAGAECRPRNL